MQQDMADGQTKALIQDPRGSYTEDGGGQRNFLRLIEFLHIAYNPSPHDVKKRRPSRLGMNSISRQQWRHERIKKNTTTS